MTNGPLPARYEDDNPTVVMFQSQLAHRPHKEYKKDEFGDMVRDEEGHFTFELVFTNPPKTWCGKDGGELVSYEEFRTQRKSWMVCNPCWAPERMKRKRF